jgi:hypothetical protein
VTKFREGQAVPELQFGIQPHLPDLFELKIGSRVFPTPDLATGFLAAIAKERDLLFGKEGLLIPLPRLTLMEREQFQGVQLLLRGVLLRSWSGEEELLGPTPEELATQCMAPVYEVKNEIIDDLFTQRLIEAYDRSCSTLFAQLIPDQLSITDLTVLLRALVRENISIRNFDVILQVIAEYVGKVGKGRILLEEIRIALGRQISASFVGSEEPLRVVQVSPSFDLQVVDQERGGALLELGVVASFIEFVRICATDPSVAILVSRGARALIRDFLWASGDIRPVLAFEELAGVPVVAVAEFELRAY